MDVRPATLADLNACLSLDHNYVTDHVWQLTGAKTEARVNVAFHIVRLPRRMRAEYPRDVDQLVEDWQRGQGFFVAEVDAEVRGYVDVVALPWQKMAWVTNLAVDRAYRRRKIGTALARRACEWSQAQGLRAILFEATTKSYPALCLYEKLGFQFCGFSDHYYSNQDIAVFFVQNLR